MTTKEVFSMSAEFSEVIDYLRDGLHTHLVASALDDTEALDEVRFNCGWQVEHALSGATNEQEAQRLGVYLEHILLFDAQWIIVRANRNVFHETGASREVPDAAVDNFFDALREAVRLATKVQIDA